MQKISNMEHTTKNNHEPSTIQEYIEAHIKEIQVFEQHPIDWTIRGKKAVEEAKQYSCFADAISRIKPQLTRRDVMEYYEKGELYVGFVATLLWGYAHTNYINNFRRIVATSKEEVEKKLNNMIAELSVNPTEMEVCFKNMCNGGKNHVPGLGVSFFTKVFYFTCRIHGKGTWILDSKMWDAYNAFLIANGKDVKKYKVSNCRYKDYMQYCDYMHKNPSVKSPDQLETFLFTHNKEIKTFLEQGNTHARVRNPKPTKHNKEDYKYRTIEYPTSPLYKMKTMDGGHYVLEEEELTIKIKGAPIFLILARTQGGSHFCGFWNKDVPNTNFDSVSEIQDIINNLSVSPSSWTTKPQYSRKYVMYNKSKDSYIKAKELKDEISEYIHNMNK